MDTFSSENNSIHNMNKQSPCSSLDNSSDKTKEQSPMSIRIQEDALHVRRLQKRSQRGSMQLIMGPMFAGKSTELLRRVNRLEISGKKCLSVKFSADKRYANDSISTHDK